MVYWPYSDIQLLKNAIFEDWLHRIMIVKAMKLFLLSLIVLSAAFSNAQTKKNLEYSGFFDSYYFRGPWSITAGTGLNFYNGDLATLNKGNKISPTYNVGVAYKPWPKVRFGVQVGMMNFDVEDTKKTRNYIMKSSVVELMFYGKYYLIEDIVRKHSQFRKEHLKLIKPFFSLGFAPVYYSAKTTDSLNIENTQSGVTFAVPVGGGIQFDITRRVGVSLDLAYRYVFSDKLDAYDAEEGGGSAKDSYATIGITLQYSPFAKRLHKKKFKAPKDSEDLHYGTSGDSTGTNTTAPDQTDTESSNTSTPIIENEEFTSDVEDEPAEEAPIEEIAREEETEDDDEYYEEDEYSDDSYDDNYDDGW